MTPYHDIVSCIPYLLTFGHCEIRNLGVIMNMTSCHLIMEFLKIEQKPTFFVNRMESDTLSCSAFGSLEKKSYLKGEEGG